MCSVCTLLSPSGSQLSWAFPSQWDQTAAARLLCWARELTHVLCIILRPPLHISTEEEGTASSAPIIIFIPVCIHSFTFVLHLLLNITFLLCLMASEVWQPEAWPAAPEYKPEVQAWRDMCLVSTWSATADATGKWARALLWCVLSLGPQGIALVRGMILGWCSWWVRSS